jgi:hypothetical protein
MNPQTIAAMRRFSVDEAAFAERGFVIVADAVDAAAMRDEVYALIDADVRSGAILTTDRSLRPPNVMRSRAVLDFIASTELYESVKPLFDGDPVLCSLGANCVPPGAFGMGMHRDYPYLSRRKKNLQGPLLCLQLILALDGMDEHNGATNVFPGSHRGALEKPVKLVCAPGSLAIMHGALMHSVESNRSAKPRTNLLASFAPYWVRPYSDLVGPRSAEELADPRLRHLLGLDFLDRAAAEIPYANFVVKRGVAAEAS